MPASEFRPTAGPFSGITVIDLSHVLAGPFGTTIFCDLGRISNACTVWGDLFNRPACGLAPSGV
jgi:hypothetical protein